MNVTLAAATLAFVISSTITHENSNSERDYYYD